jgi:hypothetical protein
LFFFLEIRLLNAGAIWFLVKIEEQLVGIASEGVIVFFFWLWMIIEDAASH